MQINNLHRTPVVGETLYSLNINNAARYGVEQKLTPVTVVKIGTKLFTVKNDYTEIQYYLYSWAEKNDCIPNSELYESPQEWEDAKESLKIIKELRNLFSSNNDPRFTIENLRKIKEILK